MIGPATITTRSSLPYRYEAQKKAYEEEQAKRDPWEEEKLICEQLLLFVEKHLPKKKEEMMPQKVVEHPKGVNIAQKADLDADDPFASLRKSKSKRKGGSGGGGAGAGGGGVSGGARSKPTKLTHAPDDFALWDKLDLKAPATTDDCAALKEQLLAKREWLKTAPPKKKKEEKMDKEGKGKGKAAAAASGKASAVAAKAELITLKVLTDSFVSVSIHL